MNKYRASIGSGAPADKTASNQPTDRAEGAGPQPNPLNAVEAACSIRPLAEQLAANSEAARTLDSGLVEALWDTGLMSCLNAYQADGADLSLPEAIDMWIELASQDGSLGWIGIANPPSTMAASAYLPDAGFDEIFATDDRATVAGQFFPNGSGERVEGGYTVTGTWNFGSGIGHSSHIAAGFFPIVDGEPQFDLSEFRVAVLPCSEVQIGDNWFVQGLRGTGSFDYSVDAVFVPDRRCFPLFTRTPLRPTANMAHMGMLAVTAAGHAGWALGVARSMLDDVAELAQTKARMSDMDTLANRNTFQRNLAHHTAMWRAARAGTIEAFTAAEAQVSASHPITPQIRADLRAAATYATEAAREVGQWAHLAAGTSAIREGTRLERAFRDLYTGTQHAFISEKTYIDAAQIWLGLEEDLPGV